MEKFTNWLEGMRRYPGDQGEFHGPLANRRHSRPIDSKGERVRPIGEYILKAKTVPGAYYGGGRLHSPQMVADAEKAVVVTGSKLLSFEDWTSDWEAVKIDETPKF
jgi:hypothetical protein